jgi:hypothetical protein
MSLDREGARVSGPGLGRRNRLFGWCLFLAGIAAGVALGTGVVVGPLAAPARFADYASLPRRLIRFAHIACMALGLTNVLYGHEIDRLRLAERTRRFGSWCMIASGALMPTFLTLAAFENRWKWGLALPSTAALVAVAILVRGLARREEP